MTDLPISSVLCGTFGRYCQHCITVHLEDSYLTDIPITSVSTFSSIKPMRPTADLANDSFDMVAPVRLVLVRRRTCGVFGGGTTFVAISIFDRNAGFPFSGLLLGACRLRAHFGVSGCQRKGQGLLRKHSIPDLRRPCIGTGP